MSNTSPATLGCGGVTCGEGQGLELANGLSIPTPCTGTGSAHTHTVCPHRTLCEGESEGKENRDCQLSSTWTTLVPPLGIGHMSPGLRSLPWPPNTCPTCPQGPAFNSWPSHHSPVPPTQAPGSWGPGVDHLPQILASSPCLPHRLRELTESSVPGILPSFTPSLFPRLPFPLLANGPCSQYP